MNLYTVTVLLNENYFRWKVLWTVTAQQLQFFWKRTSGQLQFFELELFDIYSSFEKELKILWSSFELELVRSSSSQFIGTIELELSQA